MDAIIVGTIVMAAVWYLFKQFHAALKNKEPGCGCGGCGSCPAALPPGGGRNRCDCGTCEDRGMRP